MDTQEKIKIMNEAKTKVITYLQGQIGINTEALKTYEDLPIQNIEPEIKKMREIEAIKLRDRIYELTRHIAVIEKM